MFSVPAAHEIIDLNGFTIKRRKTDTAFEEPRRELPNANVLATPYGQQERSSMATQRTPCVEEYEITAELYEHLSRSLHEVPEGALASDRLLAICGSVCRAEVEVLAKEGKPELTTTLDTIFKAFLDSLTASARQGMIRFSTPVNPLLELDADDLKVDLEARKSGLKNRLEILQKEESEWHDLLSKVEELDLGTSALEDQEGGQEGASVEYAREEIAALRALQHDVHRQMTAQVDGVCMLVGNIEDLIDRANRTAQEVQIQNHQRRFRAFKHMNSPARLIKAIIQAPGAEST